jgi:hypothetical protein
MFCALGFVFGGFEGVGSRFHVLCPYTHFRRYRGRQVSFSNFAFSDTFSAVPRKSGLVFIFCVPTLVFGGTESVGSFFHVLHFWTHFRRYRGRRVPFSYFARPDSFSVLPRASGLVFMFCAPGLIFDDSEGDGSCFHGLRPRTFFRRYRGRRVPLSCFELPGSFSAVPMASAPILIFCAPELIFDGTEGVRSRFHVLRSRIRFRRF